MNTKEKNKKIFRAGVIVCLFVLWLVLLTMTASAEIYVGRYGGQVAWSFEADTGELRIYADCGTQSPGWQPMAEQIRTVYIAPGTTRIPDAAFRGCTALTELSFPDTVTVIGAYAFDGCSALTDVTLPESLTYIGEHALRGCTSLKCLQYTGSSEQWEMLCVRVAAVQGNDTLTARVPTYTRPTYTLTVVYINADTGEAVAPNVTRTLTFGSGTTVPSPIVDMHEADERTVVVTGIAADTTVTVRYHRTQCSVQLHFVDEQKNVVLPSQRLAVAYGSSLSFSAPAVEGYLIDSAQSNLELEHVTNATTEHTFVYSVRRLSVTLHCLDENGQALCEPPVLNDIPYGGDYRLELPVLDGYLRPTDFAEGSGIVENLTLAYHYTPRYFTLTLRYIDTDGVILADDEEVTVRYGTTFSRAPKPLEGYQPCSGEITLSQLTHSQSIEVVYERSSYTLTVLHVATDGTLLQQTRQTLLYGQPYTLTPLSFTDYTMSEEQPSALSGSMPASPLTVTIQYRIREPSNLPDATTPPEDVPSPTQEPSNKSLWLLVGLCMLIGVFGIALLFVNTVLWRRHRASEPGAEK